MISENFNLKNEKTMKKTVILFGAAAAAALLSCQKEGVEPTPAGLHEINILASGEAEGRTVLGADGLSVTWSASGEKLAVLQDADGEISYAESAEGTSSDNGLTMKFQSSFETRNAASYSYYAAYPSSSYDAENNTAVDAVRLNLPSTQHPTATSFCPASDILVAKPVSGLTAQPENLELQFKRVTAIGKMSFKGISSTYNVKTVEFSSTGKKLAGSGIVSLKFDLKSGYAPADGETSDTIVLDYSGQEVPVKDMTAYFSCWPATIADGETFKVTVTTTGKEVFERVATLAGKELVFTAGQPSSFTVDFSSQDPEPYMEFDTDWSNGKENGKQRYQFYIYGGTEIYKVNANVGWEVSCDNPFAKLDKIDERSFSVSLPFSTYFGWHRSWIKLTDKSGKLEPVKMNIDQSCGWKADSRNEANVTVTCAESGATIANSSSNWYAGYVNTTSSGVRFGLGTFTITFKELNTGNGRIHINNWGGPDGNLRYVIRIGGGEPGGNKLQVGGSVNGISWDGDVQLNPANFKFSNEKTIRIQILPKDGDDSIVCFSIWAGDTLLLDKAEKPNVWKDLSYDEISVNRGGVKGKGVDYYLGVEAGNNFKVVIESMLYEPYIE